jgi:release factor glutamine methyltransferase
VTPLRSALAAAAARLESAGVPSPWFDAEALAAHSLGVERGELWRHDAPGEHFQSYVDRRAAREPLQHITGLAFFRHLTLAVGPGVFVPRPETELVAGAAIEAASAVLDTGRVPVVVDLGTGSAAIALAVADEVSPATVLAVEADPEAHSWALRNCTGSSVLLRLGDMVDAFHDLDGTVDVVVSNPPYIPVGAHIRDAEVAEHDPPAALWSGTDGLDAIRAVESVGARLLRAGGLLVVEHADVQGRSAPGVLLDAGRWHDVEDHRDLAGRDRYVTAVRGGPPGRLSAPGARMPA